VAGLSHGVRVLQDLPDGARMSRRVIVTGATGFIGRHVSRYLVASGAEVRAIVRPESMQTAPAGVATVRTPLEPSALTAAFRGADVVVHLAGVTSALRPQAYTDVNVEGARAVATAARQTGARLIHISSLAAAGPAPAGAPRREDDPPQPITPYGRSKLAGEGVVACTSGLRWTILRPAVVYGPGDRALLPLFRLAERGVLPLVGRPGAAYTFVHVSDVVRAIDAAIERCRDGEIFFVGHTMPVTAAELLEHIRNVVGRRALVIRVPQSVVRAAAVVCDMAGRIAGRSLPLNLSRFAELSAEGFVCRVDRLRERLGVAATMDLAKGLADTAAWYREAGWLQP
jgi:nucleoside-diphosphate-sugar epimerase